MRVDVVTLDDAIVACNYDCLLNLRQDCQGLHGLARDADHRLNALRLERLPGLPFIEPDLDDIAVHGQHQKASLIVIQADYEAGKNLEGQIVDIDDSKLVMKLDVPKVDLALDRRDCDALEAF